VVVELRERHPALAGDAPLLLHERGEPALGVGLDRLHRPGAVEQEVEVGEVLVGHALLLRRSVAAA
jgi:hypothetical protein